ncbi:hypothetical protein M8J76_015062 [Diaphorina citri]|nr:hypothetical protein M8J75_000153 [Diaphorina citri]KAI5737612.1 hypothetical protein M8J76_015062 [Diaphorina citri]KAI5743585.1 hypothetical protein M8J77_019866 [Diaphorina citri]
MASAPVSSYMLSPSEQPKYPKAVFFIVINEFCERFCYYGMRTVLSLYMHLVLLYDEKTATVMFHIWTGLCYFFPLFGGIIADTYLGKFLTIVILSIVYLGGNVLLTVTAIDPLNIPKRTFTLVGLLLIAVGTGGIKPCVSSFGGDQFIVPEQSAQLEKFFSLFYFSINAGSLISTFITPIFRHDIQCFGQEACFPLAFGVPALLMFLAIIVFIIGKPMYKINKPKGNVALEVFQCTIRAIKNKFKTKKSQRTKEHWLDYANDKYDQGTIEDIKTLLRILLLFVPLPIFWALFDQQGSRWTFQANRMDGRVFGTSLEIKPDQMQLINPLLILTFIPLFQYVIYPLVDKCGLNRPLRKLTVGGLLAALSFVVSALVEFNIRAHSQIAPQDRHFSLRIYNSMDCDFVFHSPLKNERVLRAMDMLALNNIPINGTQHFAALFEPSTSCPYVLNKTFQSSVLGADGKITEYYLIRDEKQQAHLRRLGEFHDLRNINSSLKMQILYGSELQGKRITLESDDGFHQDIDLPTGACYTEYIEGIPAGVYEVRSENKVLKSNMELQDDNVYVLNLNTEASPEHRTARLLKDDSSNKVSMLWLFPQYIIITAAEIMFSITGFEFAFTQAPVSMKSAVSACWLLTTAFGNLIVAIVAEAKIFENQAYEFLLFASLMVVDMGVFALLAMRYKYVEEDEDEDHE